jgi:thymidine phosphorylase
VGVGVSKKVGDRVKAGESVFRMHYNLEERLKRALDVIESAVEVGPEKPDVTEPILEIIE